MANDVKRNDRPSFPLTDARAAPPTGSARLTLLACVVALAALLTQLPGPAEALDVLTGATAVPVSPNAPLAAVQSILLITAGLLVWSLAGWAVVVLGVGLFARLPGRSGRRARRLLPRIAPASVGRLVLAAVGVSLIAGTAACAAPGTTGPAAAAGTSIGAWSTPATPSTSPTSSAPSPGEAVSIDWPESSTAPTPIPIPIPPTIAPAEPATTPPPAATAPPARAPSSVAETATPT